MPRRFFFPFLSFCLLLTAFFVTPTVDQNLGRGGAEEHRGQICKYTDVAERNVRVRNQTDTQADLCYLSEISVYSPPLAMEQGGLGEDGNPKRKKLKT